MTDEQAELADDLRDLLAMHADCANRAGECLVIEDIRALLDKYDYPEG